MKKNLLFLIAVTAMSMSLNAQTILIDEGFENGIQDSVWTQEFVSGHTAWAVESVEDGLEWPSTVRQGSKRAYLRNTTGETQGYVTRLVSKVMDLSPRKIYQPELSFWYANPKWGADRDTLRVLYRTGPNAKWRQLAEYSTAMSNWQKVKIEDLPDVGPNYQIAFEGSDNLGRGIVLDSIKLRSAPECTVPNHILVSNKGANRVSISWAASWDAEYFEMIVSKDTINPYDITEDMESQLVFHGQIDRWARSYDLTLEAGEYYYVYIRSVCENEISLWSSEITETGPYGFRVRATKQVPYFNDFNYPTSVATVAQYHDPEWTWVSEQGNLNPYVNAKQTASEKSKYALDKSAAVIFSGLTKSGTTNPTTVIPAGNYVYVATPALADTTNENFALNQCQVHFWSTVYIYTGRQYGRSLIVGVMDDPDDLNTFMPIDTVTIWGNKTFQENIVDLGSYSGHGMYVAFLSNFDRQNLFYIDDVSIEYRPAYNKVTKISVNPRDTYATISWEGNAPSYNVLITNTEVSDPSNPDAEAVVDQAMVTGNSYLCQALEADHSWNRPYYVYVQAQGQEWSYRYPFVTIASQREIPYSYEFEGTTSDDRYKIGTASTYYPTGIGIFSNSQAYPSIYDNKSYAYKGSKSMTLNKTAGADAWITLPMVENLDSTQVKFFLSGGPSAYAKTHASIGVMTNPMDINTFTKVADFTLSTAGYTMCYANFINYTGEDGVIAIVWDDVKAMTENTLNYLDDIRVEELAECVPPSNVSLEVFSDSITLRWDKSQNYEWEVLISRSALTTAEKDNSFAALKAMSKVIYADTLIWDNDQLSPEFGINNLQSQRDYYLYIRTVCGGASAWWTEMSFHTPCPNADFPFKENFEGLSSISELGCWQMEDYLGTGYPMLYSVTGQGKTLELWSTGTTHRNVAIMPNVEGDLSNMLLSFETRSWSTSASSVLYVGTMGDINDQSTFVPFDTIRNTGGSEFQKVRLILSNYNLEYNNIAFSSGLGSLFVASDVLIDNIELKDATCMEADQFKQTAKHENSVDFEWSGLSTNDQWEIRVLNTNVSIANVAAGNYDTTAVAVINDTIITGKSFHVEDLNPISTYYVYVRVLCGDSTWTSFSVQTACQKMDPNIPNRETFESYSSGTSYSDNYQAQCWTVGNGDPSATSSYIPYIYKYATYSNSGTNTYRLNGSAYYDYTPAYVVSPEIDCTHMKDLMVTFNMYCSTSYDWLCGVMDDPDDLSTFVVLDSVSGTGSSVQYTYDLSEYETLIPPTARYFAWRTPYDETSSAYLDDVSILRLQCPFTKPTYSDLTAQSVRVNAGLRTDGEWMLLVTTEEIPADSLSSATYTIPASISVFYDTIDVRTKRVTGLSEQTRYYGYTASLCDDGMSPWSMFSFVTPCLPQKPNGIGTNGVITFSTEEGFVTGSGANRYLPCWTIGSKTSGISGASSYYPYVDTSTNHNDHNSLRIYDYVSSTSSNVGAYAIMPELNVDSIQKYQVNFWGKGQSASYNSQIIVGIVTDPSDLNTFVAVDTVDLNPSAWEYFSVGFEEYEGDYLGDIGSNIMFVSEFGITNYAYISEISVTLIPRCRPISSFKVDSVGESRATISLRGYQDNYRILLADRVLEDNEKATYRWLLDSLVSTSDHIILTGLQPATNYYVYAQGICEAGDSTEISMQFASIRTECPTTGGVPMPFYEDFLAYPAGAVDPGCWIFRGSSYTHIFELTQGSKTYHAIDLYTSSGSSTGWIVAPAIDAPLEDLQLSFEARTYGSSAATLYIGTMADPEDPTTFVAFDTVAITQSTFTLHQLNLGEYDLAYDRLAFTSGFGTVASDLYISNIGLEMLSPCHAPKLKVAGTTFDEIQLQIIPSKEENDLWDIVIIEDSVYTTIRNISRYLDTTSTRMRVDTTSLTFENLKPATSYYIYARTACGDVYGNSPWSKEPLKAHTQFYFKENYFFGFEKSERWERSTYSKSDNYYLHPALIADRDTLGEASTSYTYYPYSQENTSSTLYAHTGTGALTMYASGNYHGGYVIFPVIANPQARSFEFKVRPGTLSVSSYAAMSSYDGVLEIGTIDKNRTFDTYEPLATIRLDKIPAGEKGKADNNYLYRYYTLDLDENTIATKQIVLYQPYQPSLTSYLYIDDVAMDEAKGYSLVSLKKITPSGTTALVEWANVGGPWNLYIKDEEGAIATQILGLTGVTSYLVEGLQPSTEYTAVLEAAGAPEETDYEISSTLHFSTVCPAIAPDENGSFVWNFDDETEWEPNDVLSGTSSDSLYLKPSCFQTGITYSQPANGYQWLIQRKGYDYYSTAIPGSSYAHYEVGRNDSHALRVFTASQYYNSYIVLPELQCDLDTMMIEFYGRCFVNYDESYSPASSCGQIVGASYLGANYCHSLVVGVLSDPNDLSTLQVIDTLSYKHTGLTSDDNVNDDPDGLRYWELMQLPLSGVEGSHIVLFQPAPGLFILDDLAVKPIGNTIFAPSNAHTGAVGTTTADFSWKTRHPNLNTIVVVTDAMGTEVLRDTISGESYTAQNLNSGAAYQWYVFQTDGTNNSQTTTPLAFATECVPVTPEYSCSFETEEGWNVCWTAADPATDNSGNYSYSHTGSSAYFLKGSNNSRPYIAMPEMDVNAYDTLEVVFWMRPAYINVTSGKVATTYTGSSYSKSIIVGTMTDPADTATFMAIDTVTFEGTLSTANMATEANHYLFQEKKVALAGATGAYIAFRTSYYAKGSTTRQSLDYIYLDDVSFARINDCKTPTSPTNDKVGADFALLSWTGEANSYLLQVSQDPYFAEEEDFVFNDTVYADSYRVEGLSPMTNYSWRVQALCGGRFAESDFSHTEQFTTFRSPYFLETFEAAAVDWTFCTTHADDIVDGTATLGTTDNSYGFKRTNNNFGLTGWHYTSVGYLSDYNWMVSPIFYLPENDSVHVAMDLALTACNTSHTATANPISESDMKNDYYFMIIVSEDGGETWKSENIISKWQNTNPAGSQLRDIPATGETVRFSLAKYAGKNIRIGLYREAKSNSNTGIAIHVDNFRLAFFDKVIDYASGCQYEDIQVGDIFLPGDETEPGIHIYPSSTYASEEDARAGVHDFVYSLEIEVFEAPETIIKDTICEGETYTDINFHGKNQTGVYRRKMESVHGCDSTISLYLTVLPRTYGEDLQVAICAGDSYIWHGKPYSRAGIYRDTLVSAVGCDSIETLIVSYQASEDTIFASSRVELGDLPFTYVNDQYPYIAGQTPIYYEFGTPKGIYRDTVLVEGTECTAVLVHTLTLYDKHEAIDQIDDSDARGAQKVIFKDQMYIICNDEWYNATGQKVADPRH